MAKESIISTPFFKHDYYAAVDPKIRVLRRMYGAEGYAVYFLFLEYTYRALGKAIKPLDVACIAEDLGMDVLKVEEILSFACSEDCGYLLSSSPDGYYSNRVLQSFIEVQAEQNELKEKMRSLGAKGGKKKAENASLAHASDR